MKPTAKNVSILVAFAILLLVVIANTVVTRRQLAAQVERRNWLAHSQEVLLSISQVSSSLKDAETGQRGFLYTNDPRYLDPYERALRNLEAQRKQLKDLTADNSQQQARIFQLNGLIDSKLQELAKTIELTKIGQTDEAKALVLTNLGKQTMDNIRQTLDEIWRAEQELAAIRTMEYQSSVRGTIWSLYLSLAFVILAIVGVGYFVALDFRNRERYALAMRQSEEWFRVTLNSIGDGVVATDPSGNVTFINKIAEELIGTQNSITAGKPITSVFPIFNENTNAPVENPVGKVISNGAIVGLANHTILVRTDGKRIPIEDSAAPIRNDRNEIIGVVLVFRDASQDRHAQQLLRRAEKLAAAGRLAATMAHEINNPLEAVANLIYIVRTLPELTKEAQDYLTAAEQQLDRVSHITRQTLGFYRESTQRTSVQLPTLIDSVLKLYQNKLRGKNISVNTHLESAPAVDGYAGELRQLIANLVSNALDALPSDGELSISATAKVVDGYQGVEVEVSDNGPGVAPENVDRIFEPFFTTKADVGTGLGLWVAKEIAERHGGYLKLVPKGVHPGATFVVFLPAVNAKADSISA